MAKWGDGYRWGGGTLWGQAGGGGVVSDPYSGDVVWVVNIDWYGTGGVNEAEYMRDLFISRGRQNYVTPAGTGFEKMRPGKATITMDNSNGRFDPYNVDSPIYGYILPGRKIQVLVYDVATKEMHIRFTGHISDIQPSSGINEVTITAEDGIRWLTDAEYSSGVTYSKTVSEAINLVLSFVNWPYQRNIQPSVQPLQVFEPGRGQGDSGSAITVIQELAEANLGAFFIDRFGTATFYPVSYDVTTSHDVDQAQLLREIRIPQPWETVRNKIHVIANRRGKRPASAVWVLAGAELFAAGQAKSFTANFKSSDGLTVESLVANSQSDGNGNDVSGNFTVGKSAVTSKQCTLTVTNNSGAAAYLLSMRLVGSEIVSSPETMTATDATSIAAYGPRTFVLDNVWLQDRGYATAYATMLKDHLKDPHKDPIIQIQQRPGVQYPIDLYDKVVLTSTKLGISATFTVGGMEEQWMSDTGQDVVTTYYLQTVLYDNTAITPDPYDPGALPDVVNPDFPYWFDPYIPPLPDFEFPDITPDCVSGGNTRNGPYLMNPSVTTLTTTPPVLVATINYPCTIRPASVFYKTQIWLTGKFYELVNGLWQFYVPNDILEVVAFNSLGAEVLTATITGGGTAQTPRIATFTPAAAVEVAGFKIKLVNNYMGSIPSSDVSTSTDGMQNVVFNFTYDDQGWIPSKAGVLDNYVAATTNNAEWMPGYLTMTATTDSVKYSWQWEPPAGTAPTSTDSYVDFTLGSWSGFWGRGWKVKPTSNYNADEDYTGSTKWYPTTDNVGLDVEYFTVGNANPTVGFVGQISSFIIHGFTLGASTNKKIVMETVHIWNVCGTGIL